MGVGLVFLREESAAWMGNPAKKLSCQAERESLPHVIIEAGNRTWRSRVGAPVDRAVFSSNESPLSAGRYYWWLLGWSNVVLFCLGFNVPVNP